MKYVFVVTGFNCVTLAEKCVESLKRVKFNGEWRAILCSDGSTDGTTQYVHEVARTDERFSAQHTTENMGATFQRHHAIMDSNLDDEDVILLIGLDDEVLPDILTEVDKQYKNGKWMTYGNWIDERGKTLADMRFTIHYSKGVHEHRAYRQDDYRATAVNTFKFFLYKEIPAKDLIINDRWITTTTESEIMFSCMEMCGFHRIGVIEKPIYMYNRNLPKRSLNRLGNKYGLDLGRAYKYEILDIIKKRPKRNLIIR